MKISRGNFIRELLKKNERALDFVIDEYGSLVNGIVRNVLKPIGDNGIIEECLSDIFYSVWEKYK